MKTKYFQTVRVRLTARQVLLAGGAMATLAAVGLTAAAVLPNADQAAVEQVVTNALTLEQTAPVPPASYHGGLLPDQVEQALEGSAKSNVSKYYTQPRLDVEINLLTNAIRGTKDGRSRYLAGGVSAVNFTDVAISADQARVQGDAVVWNMGAQDLGHGLQTYHPTGRILLDFRLVKRDGGWYISEEHTPFSPGQAP